jgi:uncharacterized protein (DUF885 family)
MVLSGTIGCERGPNPSEVLAGLAGEYWQGTLAANPLLATSLGDRRYDHLLSDVSPAGREREWARLTDLTARAKEIRVEDLSSADRLTHAVLLTQLDNDLAALDCRLEEWVVDPGGGPQSAFLNVESYQPVRTPEEGRAMAQRWRAMGPYLESHMGNLRRGLGAGKVGVHDSVVKVIDSLRELLARPDRDWPLLRPLAVEHPDWSEAERAEFRDALAAAVREVVRPAFKAYHRFLRQEILPRARPQERPGLVALPDGLACYGNLIRVHTSFVLPPDDVHGVGLTEIERINREMESLGRKVLKVRTRKEVLRRLRSSPPLYFKSRDEVEDKARAALTGSVAALPEWFGRLPKAPCEVVRMEPHEEKTSTIAYYRQPAADGSRPGRYYVNTSAPRTRPRYEAEALAYHESIPGHHLQIALAQEIEGLPEFRKYLGSNAFVEGWALYAERLADEMKLYSSDVDRLGKLSFDAWRACRLAVDTGLHAKGWSRRRAIDFMLENSALARNNIVNEVDRYINDPGQALGYKIGQIEILRLREEARRRLGKRFDIRAFHDVVLGSGALPLDPLRGLVGEYIDRTLQSRPQRKQQADR